jgi:hypothetical protein
MKLLGVQLGADSSQSLVPGLMQTTDSLNSQFDAPTVHKPASAALVF